MPWIKRNLYLVISGVVALALLGLAVFYLLSKRSENATVTEELSAQTAAFNELINRPVHPGTDTVDNIGAAQEEAKKLQKFAEEVRSEFTPVETNTVNNQRFRYLLDNTVAQLQAEAESSGVILPIRDYWFTFEAQKRVVNFNTKSVDALASQLEDVTSITRILYDAKVHSILNLKRVPVATDDTLTSPDYTARKAETNQWAVVTPYELTFTGFTSELAAVLEGFVNAKACYIVKSVAVDKAGNPATETPSFAAPLNRYGRYAAPQFAAPQQPIRRPNRDGLTTILDENRLKFTLIVEAVKLRPAGTAPDAEPVAEEAAVEEVPQ